MLTVEEVGRAGYGLVGHLNADGGPPAAPGAPRRPGRGRPGPGRLTSRRASGPSRSAAVRGRPVSGRRGPSRSTAGLASSGRSSWARTDCVGRLGHQRSQLAVGQVGAGWPASSAGPGSMHQHRRAPVGAPPPPRGEQARRTRPGPAPASAAAVGPGPRRSADMGADTMTRSKAEAGHQVGVGGRVDGAVEVAARRRVASGGSVPARPRTPRPRWPGRAPRRRRARTRPAGRRRCGRPRSRWDRRASGPSAVARTRSPMGSVGTWPGRHDAGQGHAPAGRAGPQQAGPTSHGAWRQRSG